MAEANDYPAINNTLNKAVQVGLVVRDLDSTMKALRNIFGFENFREVTWPIERSDMKSEYHGSPGNFKFRIAFTQLGPIELEIIQPLEGENIYQDFLESHGEGLHHLLFEVDDIGQLQKGLEPLGINMIQSGTGIRPGTTWAYFDTASLVGFFLEVRNRVPGSDGTTPVPSK